MINVLAEDDFIKEDHCIRVSGVIDDMSLMITNKDVENNGREKNHLSWYFTITMSTNV